MTGWNTVDITTLDAVAWREHALAYGAEGGVRAALDGIGKRNDQLNAFTVVLEEQALADAARLDAERAAGDESAASLPLWGVPVAIKEEVDVAGCVTTFGTRGNSTPKTADSEVVSRLRDAGAIIIGKTTMPAFGAFPFTESEATGVTPHPEDPTRSPGGSSGGTAVAVAAGLVPVGIGGDGGGSIRIPAAHCGLVGLKPARGAVPTAPYPDLWCALGTAGALTKSVRDARLMFEVLAGVTLPPRPARPLRIAVDLTPVSPLHPPHKDHGRAVNEAAERLRAAGHEVVRTRLKSSDPTPPFLVQFFAGIRAEIAGLEHPERIEARHKHTRALGFWATPKVVRWAVKASERIGAQVEGHFADFDLILTPTVSSRPARAGVLSGKGLIAAQLASLSSVSYTAKYNVSGHPAIAVPLGRGRDGLPVSVQLVASRRSHFDGEGLLLDVADALFSR